MIYFVLTLFFASLVSIVFMIGRKLVLLKNGQIHITEDATFEIPYLKEARHLTITNVKKYEHIALVLIVKFYLQFSNFLKNKYRELKDKIHNIHINKYPNGELKEKIEASKLIKTVSSYTHRIKKIKQKIKEAEKEENNL